MQNNQGIYSVLSDIHQEDSGRLNVKNQEDMLCFYLSNQEFGLNLTMIREVIEIMPITRVPYIPDFILGVINLRGKIIAIMEIQKVFQLPPTMTSLDERILIITMENLTVGIKVDRLSKIKQIPLEKIDPPPPGISIIEPDYIRGVIQLEDHPLILLNWHNIMQNSSIQKLINAKPE